MEVVSKVVGQKYRDISMTTSSIDIQRKSIDLEPSFQHSKDTSPCSCTVVQTENPTL